MAGCRSGAAPGCRYGRDEGEKREKWHATDVAMVPPGLAGGPIYLNYNATAPTDPRVIEAMLPYLGLYRTRGVRVSERGGFRTCVSRR